MQASVREQAIESSERQKTQSRIQRKFQIPNSKVKHDESIIHSEIAILW